MHNSAMENTVYLTIFVMQNYYCITHMKKKSKKTTEYQSDELDHNLIENNHEGCS